MFRALMPRLSYANVVASVALFVALGGVGYAATQLPANSVGSAQIKPKAVANSDLGANAVTGAKVKVGSLDGTDLKKKSLTASQIDVTKLGTIPSATSAITATNATHANSADSATSAATATNATHANGADHATTADTATALGRVSYRFDTSAGPVTVLPCSSNPCTPDKVGTATVSARCPAGTVAIGGGGVTNDLGVELSGSFPAPAPGGSDTPNTWVVSVDNYLQTSSTFDYYAVCAKAAAVDVSSGF